MDVIKTLSLLASYFVLVVSGTDIPIDSSGNTSSVCYGYLGCFPMASPWYSLTRPLPAPQSPDVIATGFYLYTRAQPARYYVTKLPDISLTGSDFSGVKPTFLITHGYVQNGNTTWLSDLKDALLLKYDANVIIVDWGHGSLEINYLQAAANIRVVAAEVVRLCNYLFTQGSSPSSLHLIGHSLGAQCFSYVAKAIPGVARLTALDPAQPGFEGYDKAVRLDVSDAVFVLVIHTNGAPFIPLLGFGMMGPYGHVDFFVNGGKWQPGCVDITYNVNITKLSDLGNASYNVVQNIASCSHCRSYEYLIESLKSSCNFWGKEASLGISGLQPACSSSSCSPMSLDAINYPARGSFQVNTYAEPQYCIPDNATDAVMKQYRQA